VVRLRRGSPPIRDTFFALTDFLDGGRIETLRRLSDSAVVDLLDETLQASVKAHLFADVPVGAFCSGGVDSSIITAMAARQTQNLAIFHADVRGRWSEHDAAAALARHLKLDLHTVAVRDEDFIDRIPDVMAHYEHPFTYHPNCAPLLMVAQLARQTGVKGLLSGEGSDECFLGYPWLGRKRLVDAWERGVHTVRRLASAIPGFGRVLFPLPTSTPMRALAVLSRREMEDDREQVRAAAARFGPDLVSERDCWSLDWMGHHLRTLLHRNDTMGMAASIEARFPFLDHELVAMAVNLPFRHKLRVSPTVFEKAHPFVRDKWIVREVARRYVPPALSQRIKIGFWTTVFQRSNVAAAYFDRSFVGDLLELSDAQMRATVATADQDFLMRLLHLDVWGRCCVRGETGDSARRRLHAHMTVRAE
jgi:asparagine synthase (glutamine-hydrolysing)